MNLIKNKDKIQLAIFYFVLGGVFVGIMIDHYAKKITRFSDGQAEYLNAFVCRKVVYQLKSRYEVHYRYSYKGSEYQGKGIISKRHFKSFRAGDSIRVAVNKIDPKYSEVADRYSDKINYILIDD